MQEFNRAPGDRSKNGEMSQEYVDQIKNQSTTTISGLSGKKDLSGQTVPEGKISNVRFTTAMLPDRTVVPAVSLSIQTGTNNYSTHVLQFGDVYGDKDGLQNFIVNSTTADILSEAYTYTYNNPASSSKGSPAIVTRHFTDGVLESKFYPTIGDNNAFMGYGEVKTTFTRGDGNVITQTLSLSDFLYQYNDL
jgi:hypothetical protein